MTNLRYSWPSIAHHINGGALANSQYEKIRRGEKEGGQKFLPLKPLPFCPPKFIIISPLALASGHIKPLKIIFKKGSDFVVKRYELGIGKLMNKDTKGRLNLFREIVFGRIGIQNDFVGYETLLEFIEKNRINALEGDFLEIGAFMGGGSAKLARDANRFNKKLL